MSGDASGTVPSEVARGDAPPTPVAPGPRARRRFGIVRWSCRIARSLRLRFGRDRTTYVSQRRDEYRGYWEAAAHELGAEFTILTRHAWQVRRNGHATRISNHVVQTDDLVTLRLAGDKGYCYRVASSVGLPIPVHWVGRPDALDELRRFRERVGGLLVVKPARATSSGLGITTHVRTAWQLERAAALASLFCDEVLVEQMVFGESYRLLFLDGELLHAVRRRGVRIVGDGETTVHGLIRHGLGARAARDPEILHGLAHQELTLSTVLAAGREVLVRSRPVSGRSPRREVRTIYDEAITPLLSADLLAEVRQVVSALGTRFAGVDLITCDPSRALGDVGGVFLEVNTTPGIHHHYLDPSVQATNSVAVRVLDAILR